MRSWSSNVPVAALALGLAALAGCSLINKPDPIDPGTGGGTTTASSSTGLGGNGPMCTKDEQCTMFDSDCHKGKCGPDGNCVAEQEPEGTACGSATASDCDAADTCDATGACKTNLATDGTFCDDCAAGPGLCTLCKAGACSDCTTRATSKRFETPLSTAGWTFTGGWGVYEQTPPAQPSGIPVPYPFARPVIGTDGNRSHPYPGGEHEVSSAVSPPSILPAQLTFQSWNWDEGGIYDQKTISVSIDGGNSFTVVAVCPNGNPNAWPFCHAMGDGVAGNWLPVTIDFAAIGHPEMIGKVGIVRFAYDTGDNCCQAEVGWYLDELNFATDCACATPADCADEGGECGIGTCDIATGECGITPLTAGMVCGDTMDETCSAPDTCDTYGLCNPNSNDRDGLACEECSDGAGLCLSCGGGVCLNCPPTQTFDSLFLQGAGWTLTGAWNLYGSFPSDTIPQPSGSPYVTIPPPFGAVLGTDGPKVAPYYTWNGTFYSPVATQPETSSAITPPVVIPDNITFKSWHRDRGGQSGRDTKRVRVSVDGGANFTTLVDCNGGALHTLPFCSQVMSRPPDQFDDISIPTGALAGQTGIVEFDYDSVDAGFDWEGGWYIDELNVARCGDH